jgi:hypothetical protein
MFRTAAEKKLGGGQAGANQTELKSLAATLESAKPRIRGRGIMAPGTLAVHVCACLPQ